MQDETHHLLRLRGLLESMGEVVDRLAAEAPASDDEKRVLGIAATAIAESRPRTRADVLRFVEALKGGDDGWLLVRSVSGEFRIDAVYLAKLPPSVRKTLDI